MLEDNLRTPSGVSYVMENRRVMARVFPDLFGTHRVRPVDDYPRHLLRALRHARRHGRADPRSSCSRPGSHNSAYFEHSLLARQMGVELVEGRDLFCRDNVIYMRTTDGRASGSTSSTAASTTSSSTRCSSGPTRCSGCAGLLNAARAGNVTIANAVGNGVGDDKLIYTYVPDLIEYYLGEKPLLPNVETYRLGEEDVREFVLDRLDQLVVKPVDGSGGYGLVFGPDATDEELGDGRRNDRRGPAGLDRPAGGAAVDRARPWSTVALRPATSTCARSRSTTARRSGCCPAG